MKNESRKQKGKMSKGEKKYKKLKIIIPIYLVIVIGLASFIYLIPKITNRFDDTYTAEYGTLEVGFDCKCLVVRNERLHTSEEEGTLTKIATEGNALRKNARIVNVGDTGYYNQVRGVVSYSYDGLENNLTPDELDSISSDYIEAAETNMEVKQVSDTVSNGDVIFKIVDNQTWYLITWIDEMEARSITEGRTVTVKITEDQSVKMKVYKEYNDVVDDKVKIIFSCNRIYEGYLSKRVMDVKVITKSRSGILIETDSIVVEGKEGGVMKVDKYGNSKFVPIKILLQDEETTVCEIHENEYFLDDDGNPVYTIRNYDTILRKTDKKTDN